MQAIPIQYLQVTDAVLLMGCSLCTMFVLVRDFHHGPIVMRMALVLFGISAWAQAMWMLGAWLPNAAGFPLPRLVFDGSLFLASMTRVFLPWFTRREMALRTLKEEWLAKHKSAQTEWGNV